MIFGPSQTQTVQSCMPATHSLFLQSMLAMTQGLPLIEKS